jgi:hypothetical protein
MKGKPDHPVSRSLSRTNQVQLRTLDFWFLFVSRENENNKKKFLVFLDGSCESVLVLSILVTVLIFFPFKKNVVVTVFKKLIIIIIINNQRLGTDQGLAV